MAATRRIITDHTTTGQAIIASDQLLEPANPLDPHGRPPPPTIPGFTTIFRTTTHPASAQRAAWTDPHGKMQNLVGADGVVCRIVDFPPVSEQELERDTTNIMHRTWSVDYGVVLDGEIELVLDEGVVTVMRRGDVVVQRGTVHHWRNRSGQNCRIFFVLVPANPVVVESTGEILPATDTSHLEEPKA